MNGQNITSKQENQFKLYPGVQFILRTKDSADKVFEKLNENISEKSSDTSFKSTIFQFIRTKSGRLL